ncbi:saccharopine dehydrogenase NADP-binding domain-containing protein [Actinoplanes sp. KI2]|uniref:saccharopine dehydrogenase NADP-binding domain-containing protein n=1 Tax=Actinoplanes sp. KI2 TaxID=2983315 RepID=UPI0021D5A301|nr:saccharopine dehydrogenase NADP-binding domain-containing protein [Actinoplanes sp. KI2]MCU7728608.1 saccharopine dehydrogenase NADP-binding domain-containing protein [Actinoplanes sp. KI2]
MKTVAVFGAYGHTGRFVVAELRARGFAPLLLGRNADRLEALAAEHPGLEHRVASAGDPASLDAAVKGAAAVINCAGPFASTAGPVIEAALRARIPYVDVAAEIEANVDTFDRYAEPAREAGVVVVPAMAFYGGLGDLLVTAAIGDTDAATGDTSAGAIGDIGAADEVHVAYGLSSWQPTAGTLAAGVVSRDRRGGRRVRYTGGRLEYYPAEGDLPTVEWEFPAPLGRRAVLGGFTMPDVVTVPSHLRVSEVHTYMTIEAATGLAAAVPVEESGRTAETFTVDVVVRTGGTQRRSTASGRDIYAVSAPLAVEAVDRILTGRTHRAGGVTSAGEIFDAADFLRALSAHLTVTSIA